MKNFSIRKKLTVSFIVVIALFFISSLITAMSMINVQSKINKFYNAPYQVRGAANQTKAAMEGMLRNVLLAAVSESPDQVESAAAAAAKNSEKVQSEIAIIEEKFTGDQQLVSDLKASLKELAPHRAYALELAKQGKAAEVGAYMNQYNIPIFNKATATLDEIIDFANVKGDEMISSISDMQMFSLIIMVALTIGCVIFSMILCKYITRMITLPLKQIGLAAKELSNGNLNTDISYNSKDELGEVADSLKETITVLREYIFDIARSTKQLSQGELNTNLTSDFKGDFVEIKTSIYNLKGSLNDAMKQITAVADQVSSGSEQVAQGAQALSQSSTEQSSSMEELLATMYGVSDQVVNTASKSTEASHVSQLSSDEVISCNAEMNHMKGAMDEIQSVSQEINSIINNIEDIATQTNLLSLNAAIEAARAGDAGRGFAVVAEQVGKLASESANAVKNTSELLAKNMTAVQNGISIANKAGQSMDKMVGNVEKVKGIIDGISSEAEQQSEAIKQVMNALDMITETVQSNSSISEENSAVSEELMAQAQTMRQTISLFNLY